MSQVSCPPDSKNSDGTVKSWYNDEKCHKVVEETIVKDDGSTFKRLDDHYTYYYDESAADGQTVYVIEDGLELDMPVSWCCRPRRLT